MVDRLTLVGTTVTMEPMVVADAAALLGAASEDRAAFGFTLVPETLGAMQRYVADALDEQQASSAVPFTIKLNATGRVVGTSRFLDLSYWNDTSPAGSAQRQSPARDRPPTVAEIGSTWLSASAQRTAVNTESKLLMLTHAFEIWAVRRITLKTDARNQRSRQAIERIGAVFEGIRRIHMPATDGTDRNTAYYSILKSEWPDVKLRLTERLTTATSTRTT